MLAKLGGAVVVLEWFSYEQGEIVWRWLSKAEARNNYIKIIFQKNFQSPSKYTFNFFDLEGLYLDRLVYQDLVEKLYQFCLTRIHSVSSPKTLEGYS